MLIPDQQYRDTAESIIISLSEKELVDWRREQGVKVVEHCGRYWVAKPTGFYHPIHWMARMTAEQATRPTALCWGFRTTLCDAGAKISNATMPVHILSNVKNYDMNALSSNRRNTLRRCWKRVQIVDVLKPDLLKQQGYDVLISANKRTHYGEVPTLEQYCKNVESHFNPKRTLILAGLIDGKLGGYVSGLVIGKTSYIDSIALATNALRTNIGTGLIFELIQVFRRSATILEVIYGMDSRENQTLAMFKESMGFPVFHVPARAWFMPLVQAYIKKKRPDAYYRLTGHD
jgi:hypothetical protein